MHTIAAKATCFKIAASEAFRVYQRQVRANADALAATLDRGRARPPHRRHRHASRPDRPAPQRVDGQGRRGSPRRGEHHREPQHGAVRRAAADGRVRRSGSARLRRRCAGSTRTTSREVGAIILDALSADADLDALVARSDALCEKHPLYPGFRGYVSFARVSSVTEVTHPLVQHKVGLLRDASTTTQMFRNLVNELTVLLTYEATKDLATEEIEI